MNFFVSGKIGLEKSAKSAMKTLKKAGHKITFDWTSIGHLRPYDINFKMARKTAIKECQAVKEADVLIIIPHKKGIGMFVELGIALGLGIPVRIITRSESKTIFFHHPLVKKVRNIHEVIREFACDPSTLKE
jgi:nucleoside 2-deoxyribosyltransferase